MMNVRKFFNSSFIIHHLKNMEQTQTTHDITESQERTVRARVGSIVQQQGALVLLVLVGIIATIRYERFLTEENLLNVLRQNSML